MVSVGRHAWQAFALAVVAVPLLAGTAARAADTEPPVIQHAPLTEVDRGIVEVNFTISDQSALFGVLFHWRYAGDTEYKQVDFPPDQTTFSVRLNVSRDFEFWIEAYDEFGNGPAQDGTSINPNRVRVRQEGDQRAPAPPPAEKAATPAPEAPPPEAPPPPPPAPPPPPPEPSEPAQPWVRPLAPGPFVTTHVDRVQTARNLPTGRLELSGDLGITTGSNFLYPSSSMIGEQFVLGAEYAIHDYVGVKVSTLFSHSEMSFSGVGTTGQSLSAAILDDLTLTLHLATKNFGYIRLGLLATLELPGDATNVSGTSIVASPGVLALVSFEHPMFRFHFNIGYKWDNSENGVIAQKGETTTGGRTSTFETYALALSAYDDLSIAFAAEVPLDKLTPYAGFSADIPVNRMHFATCTPNASQTCAPTPSEFPALPWQRPARLILGLRYAISDVMAADFGVEASLTQAGISVPPNGQSVGETATAITPLAGVVLPPPWLIRIGFAWQWGEVVFPFIHTPEPWKKPKPTPKAPPPADVPAIEPPPEIPPIPPPGALDFETPKGSSGLDDRFGDVVPPPPMIPPIPAPDADPSGSGSPPPSSPAPVDRPNDTVTP